MSDINVNDIIEIKNMLTEIKVEIRHIHEDKDSYVKKDEFKPVKTIVYGMVGIFLSGSLLAVVKLIQN
jgi:hypothetical protein